ncbi:MAG TPA: ribonuclease H-like domain-containing protein [Kofleriaceae bacterium]
MARTPSAEYLILDIETVPDTDRWQRPDLANSGEPAFPPTWAHRIIVIGCLWLGHDYRLKRFGVIGGEPVTGAAPGDAPGDRPGDTPGDTRGAPSGPSAGAAGAAADHRERALLEDFSRFVGRARPVLVTYNGRSFDLPVIVMRSLCHAIALPWYYRDRDVRYRYSAEGHLDLCDWLAEHGAARAGKLDAIARLIGLPGKLGVDGSQVEGLYRAGQLASIQSYCLADVAQTALLFLRFRLLQGQIAPATYRERTTALLDTLAADGRVTEVFGQWNRERLLGPAQLAEPAPDDAPGGAPA